MAGTPVKMAGTLLKMAGHSSENDRFELNRYGYVYLDQLISIYIYLVSKCVSYWWELVYKVAGPYQGGISTLC